jgi:nitroimidazol reductase NimA-like FMN-containing flavoprotein (pyridoxamine 5'-phosphate oxidase superfamily)
MTATDLAAAAREIIDANRYLTLASADGEGEPWASPVWFAHSEYREFFWISRPEARHSRNVAARAEVAIVIFDSTVPEGEAAPVYCEARAEEVPESDRAQAIEICTLRAEAIGDSTFTAEDVVAPAGLRLYRATATRLYLLGDGDRRVAVPTD